MNKKSGLIYFLSNIFAALLGFAMIPLVTRFLTPAEYGLFSIFQSLVTGAGIFIGLNGQSLLMKKYIDSEGGEDVSRYVSSTLSLAFLTWITSFLFAFPVFILFDKQLGLSYIFLCFSLSFLMYVIRIKTVLFQGAGNAFAYALFQVGNAFLVLIGAVLFLKFFDMGLEGRIFSQAFATIFLFVIAFSSLYKVNQLASLSFVNFRYIKEFFKFGLPLLPHSILSMSMLYLDRWYIANNIGMDAVGKYSVIFQLVFPVTLLFDAFNKTYLPWIYKRLSDKKPTLLRHHIMMFLLILMASIPGVFIVNEVSVYIVPASYDLDGELLVLLYFASVFSGLYQIPNNVLFYYKKTGKMSYITSCSFLTYLVMIFLIFESYGLIGVALSVLISVVFKLFLTLIYANFVHRRFIVEG